MDTSQAHRSVAHSRQLLIHAIISIAWFMEPSMAFCRTDMFLFRPQLLNQGVRISGQGIGSTLLERREIQQLKRSYSFINERQIYETKLLAHGNFGDNISENYDPLPNQPIKSSDPEKEFELNRGLAVDTLLQDYPYLLMKAPDFSIFRKDIVLQDAQGFSISGLQAYQIFFRILRQIAGTLFSTAQVSVILGDKYATDKSRIRLRWKVELNGRIASAETERKNLLRKMGFADGSIASSSHDATFVEGISVYKLDVRGMIVSHTIQVTEPTMLAPLSVLNSFLPLNAQPSLVTDIGMGQYGHSSQG